MMGPGTMDTSGWDAAATPPPQAPPAQQSAPPQQPASTPATQTPAATPPGAPAASGTPATAPAAVPPVVTSQKRGGIGGVVDDIADALAGKTKPEIGTDAQGNQYVKQQTMTRGQQWVRIGAALVGGAAKGWAAGKGRNPGAAAAAGFDEGEKIQQQAAAATPAAQKEILANANYQKLRMDTAEQAWHLTALKKEANQHDIEFEQGQEDRLIKAGGTLLGTAENPADISRILKVDPEVMRNMIVNHQVEILAHHNEDGTYGGIRAIKMPDRYRSTFLPAGAPFHTFDATTGQYIVHHASDPITAGEVDDDDRAAGNASLKYKLDQADIEQKAAQAAEQRANADKAPSEIQKNEAQTKEANANAVKALADANKLKTPEANDPEIMNLGELAARGGLTEDQLSKMKGGALTAVQNYLALHHPNLDQTSIFLTANQRKQTDLARNSLQNVDEIAKRIAARPDLIGALNGRITQGKVGVGTDDPDIGYIEEALDNFGLATTGTHGTRAQAAREDARKALLNGFKNGPQATQQAIAAARESLSNLASAGKPRGINGQPYVYKEQQPATAPQPASHSFSPSAWKAANPTGDVNAAIAAAKAQGYPVVQ